MSDTTEKKYLDKDGLARLVANMDLAYAKAKHGHTVADITDLTATATELNYMDGVISNVQTQLDNKAASGHTHTSDKITGMTGYSKPSSTSAIAASDTLNAAIGKLEKALDGKQASGSYVPTSRKVNGKALSADITLTASDVGASASGHNHNDMYYTESEIDSKLSGKADSSHTHAAADITSVNASAITGVIAAANLPSYVDDVLEYAGTDKFPATGETGKIYTDTTTNKIYRWGGSSYVVISDTIALGETSSTAYRGDRGKIAYDHSQATGNPHGTAIGDISGLQSALDGKATASDLTSHTGNTTVHITATERTNWNAAKTHADSAHAPSNAEPNQNAFSNIKVGSTTIAADTKTDTLEIAAGTNVTITPDETNGKVTIAATDTKYSAGAGISLSGTTFSNSGVRSIATGGANGTISVNTGGTTANVAVKGLGSAAYTASSAYATAEHTHTSITNDEIDAMFGVTS